LDWGVVISFLLSLIALFLARGLFFPLFVVFLVFFLVKFVRSEVNVREVRRKLFRRKYLLLFAFFLFVIALSIPGIRFARIRSPYPTEREIASSAYRILEKGDFNPHHFMKPAGYVYFQAGVFALYFLEEGSRGRWSSIYQAEPSDFLIAGRVVNLLLMLFSLALFYLLAKKVLFRELCYLPFIFFLVLPAVVRGATFINPYPLFLIFALGSFYFLADLKERGRGFFISALLIGLAASCDYTGFLLVLPALFPLVRLKGNSKAKDIGFFLLLVLAVFFLVNPYLLAERGEAVADLGRSLFHYQKELSSQLNPQSVLRSLYNGLSFGPLLSLLIGGSVLYAIFSFEKRTLFYLSFPLSYLLLKRIDLNGEGIFLLPVIPFFLIATALVWQGWLIKKFAFIYLLRKRRAKFAFFLSLFLLIFFPLVNTVRGAIELSRGTSLASETYRLLGNAGRKGDIALSEFPLRKPQGIKVETSSLITRHPLDFYIREGYRFLLLLSDVNGDFEERFAGREGKEKLIIKGGYPYPRLSLAVIVLPRYEPTGLLAQISSSLEGKGEMEIDFKDRNFGILGRGWGDVSSYNGVPGRFAIAKESVVFLPRIEGGVELVLEVAPVVYRGSPPQVISLSLNGKEVEEFSLPPRNRFRRFSFNLPSGSLGRRTNTLAFRHRFLADPRGYLMVGTPIWGKNKRAAFYHKLILKVRKR